MARHLRSTTAPLWLLLVAGGLNAQVTTRLPTSLPPVTRTVALVATHDEASMAACIADAMGQRLPIRIAIELCRIVKTQATQGRTPPADISSFGTTGGGLNITPEGVRSACSAGVDPRLGKDAPYRAVGDNTLAALEKSTREAAAREKDPALKAGMLAEAEKMRKEQERREETGTSVDDGAKRTAEGGACAMVQNAAREFVRECNRTAWRSSGCQQLAARMKGCPNPTQILVDPDAGYACGAAADPKAVADAWAQKCAQVTTPGPDGRSPCTPLAPLGGDPRVFGAGPQNVCADTRAFIDGGSDMCYLTMEARNPLTQSFEQLVAVISKKTGGPIIVLPVPRPSGAGPEPRPRPGTT